MTDFSKGGKEGYISTNIKKFDQAEPCVPLMEDHFKGVLIKKGILYTKSVKAYV